MAMSIGEKIYIMRLWDELSEVLGITEVRDPSALRVERHPLCVVPRKAIRDSQEIEAVVRRRPEPEERPSWYHQPATRPYPKGYVYPKGMGIGRAIKEERIGVPLERFECFYEAETDMIQEAIKENLDVPGYLSYRDACNQVSWY